MKRKFSFNLAPVKVPARPDTQSKSTPEPTPSHSHRRHQDSVSSLNSPFINRRPLSPRTEHELRAACALILQDFKPSGHIFDDQAKPKLDFAGPNRRKHDTSSSQPMVYAPAETRRERSHRAGASVKDHPDLPMQANTGRRRDYHEETGRRERTRTDTKSPSMDIQRSAATRHEIDSDDGTSMRTPGTFSETHLNNGSTAPTTAAFTSGRSSKRVSRQFDSAAALADAQAAEWMRQELEKRRKERGQAEPLSPTRLPSRGRSIRSDIREYIFPNSAALSRAQSHESMRSQESEQPKRSSSSHGWRSWGLQRKLSRSSSRPGTSTGRIETQEQEKKRYLDLNRDLPPLPSLDSWDQQQKQKRKSQAQGAHIATVMRSQDQQQQDYAAAVRKHHRKSGSDTLAMQYAHAHPKSNSAPRAQIARSASNAQKVEIKSPRRSPRVEQKQEFSMNFDEMLSAMDSSSNFNDQLQLGVHSHSHQHSSSTGPRSPGLDAPRNVNFSRKISGDLGSPRRNYDQDFAYPNIVQISGLNTNVQKDEKGSKLRKVLSGWMLRKEKKENWMDQFEKNGIKGGVMIQDEAALPPVVRY